MKQADQETEEDATAAESNYNHFRDCLSTILVQHLSQPAKVTPKNRNKSKSKSSRRTAIKPVSTPAQTPEEAAKDLDDLADFADYLATDIFSALPKDLQTLTYAAARNDASLAEKYSLPLSPTAIEDLATRLPPSTTDSLTAYNLLPASTNPLPTFLTPLLNAYIHPLTTPPLSLPHPTTGAVRASACELCERDWIPLTYHHLIPRSVHAKAVKRGWCEEWRLNSVAWLCRACHSFVHGVAGNEELAKEWYSVELLRGREDVERWVKWVGKVRWKAK